MDIPLFIGSYSLDAFKISSRIDIINGFSNFLRICAVAVSICLVIGAPCTIAGHGLYALVGLVLY